MKKVCHLTAAHGPEDDRIFLKECKSLATEGYEVYLIAYGDTYNKNGVHIIGIDDPPKGRFHRMIEGAKKVYKKAVEIDADLYHFHDPELLPYGLMLKRNGKKVIFDSHEDVPSQILDKYWIPTPMRKFVSAIYKAYESHIVNNIDAVIAATPYIRDKFFTRAKIVVDIRNYPRLDDITCSDVSFQEKQPIVCYAGAISEQRGEKVMLQAMEGIDGQLIIAGCKGREQSQEVETQTAHNKTDIIYVGVLDRNGINELYRRSVLGLCMLLPTASYINALPIKIFEYMAAGLPFVCSDFPILQEIVKETGAGICVSPDDVGKVHENIRMLLDDRTLAQKMGRKGRAAVVAKYSWSNEERKLFDLYRMLL